MTADSDGSPATRGWLGDARRVVVKIGSRALVDDRYRLDEDRLASLTDQMSSLRDSGRQVICVSSGAVAAGVAGMGLEGRPRDLPTIQAAAAIGQARLIGLYRERFAARGVPIGQVLLTHADLRSRERHLNARNTLSRLLRRGAVPIINENDTVAVEEIKVGDNDVLSALVACLVRADLLVLLTTEDGLLSGPPEAGGTLIPQVDRITEAVRACAGESGSEMATGGMRSKLQSVEMVTRAGAHAIIANGRAPEVLLRLFDGEPLGTLFLPHAEGLRGRKRWIAFFDHPRGELQIDDGALRAVTESGGSLLAIGITRVTGGFDRGEPVRIVDAGGIEVARGLVNYAARDLRRIVGLRSDEIARTLGQCDYDEVVHRDNLVTS